MIADAAARRRAPESTVPPAQDDDFWIGARLRELRKDRGLSIKQLADRVGLSVGMVSQIERGLSTPSLRSLRLLANALDVPVSWFFGVSQEQSSASRHIVRRSQRRRLKVPHVGVVQELLSPEAPGDLEIYEVMLEPRGNSGPDSYSHEGEKAGLVIEGTLQLMLGAEKHLLQNGDSFRFPSTLAHSFANPSDAATRFVWIVNTPKRKRK